MRLKMQQWLGAVRSISVADDTERKYLVHETKHAVLAAALFILFSVPYMSKFIQNVFPGARGPVVLVYKVLLLIALYYIIQKTDWFQRM